MTPTRLLIGQVLIVFAIMVKITIGVPPDLNRALGDYAAAYERAYGEAEPVAELIPAMLAAFLQSDRDFHRARGPRDRAG